MVQGLGKKRLGVHFVRYGGAKCPKKENEDGKADQLFRFPGGQR